MPLSTVSFLFWHSTPPLTHGAPKTLIPIPPRRGQKYALTWFLLFRHKSFLPLPKGILARTRRQSASSTRESLGIFRRFPPPWFVYLSGIKRLFPSSTTTDSPLSLLLFLDGFSPLFLKLFFPLLVFPLVPRYSPPMDPHVIILDKQFPNSPLVFNPDGIERRIQQIFYVTLYFSSCFTCDSELPSPFCQWCGTSH